jgi:hypothetical protein
VKQTKSSNFRFLALLFLALTALPASAGLRFQPAPSPSGADVFSLAGDGATLWAGTERGVWTLSAGAWSLDGLSDGTVTSVAVADGSLWAASGNKLYRRGADGTYTVETLPGANASTSVLVADGNTLYAAGLGVFKRSGGTWTALASPGSFVTSAALYGSDLVVGLQLGGAARYPAGGGLVFLQTGVLPGEAVNAFAVLGGTLYGGTPRGLYAWSGTSWVLDASFGSHDVRGLTASGGILRAATFDAGLFRRSGTWVADNNGILFPSARCFGTAASTLFAGTAGGPVYSQSDAAWVEAGSGLDASSIVDILTGSVASPSSGEIQVASHGAGFFGVPFLPGLPPPNNQVPSGCGDVRALSFVPAGLPGETLAATNCGPLRGGVFAWSASASGLPAGVSLIALASTPNGTVAGTANSGLYRYSGFGWSPDNGGICPPASNGICATDAVTAVRQVGANLYATAGLGVSLRAANGQWTDVSNGLPFGASALALGGTTNTAFSGFGGGGIYRRDGTSLWRKDASGLNGVSSVFSLDLAGSRLFSAAGTAGVYRKREGGWLVEAAGLPAGVDARVVRSWTYDGPASPQFRSALFVGTAGHGLWVAPSVPSVKTLPVVLDVVGGTGARFQTELTFGNKGTQPVTLTVRYDTAPLFGAPGVPGGTASVSLAPGTELRAPDALDFLRSHGVPLPPALSVGLAGSLSISAAAIGSAVSANEDIYAVARTYTRGAHGGTFGLSYDAPSDLDAAEGEASIYGLRSVPNVSRTNMAVVHLPGRSSDPIVLSVQVFTDAGVAAGPPLTHSLAPGEWYQFNDVLLAAGLPQNSFGYARITRVSGIGSWTAYGVVNDAQTSDGSFLPLYRPGGLAAARRLVVPVILDAFGVGGARFVTELTIANDSPIGTPVDLVYKPAPNFGSSTGVPTVTVQLAARSQLTIPNAIQYLRDHGINIPDPTVSGSQGGTLTVTFRNLTNLDSPRTVALARTFSPNPDTAVGGSFGLFYPAAAKGGGARSAAFVPALQQDAAVRSNLAVVHLGGGSETALGLSVQLYDASTGVPVGSPLTITLQPGDWVQWSKVLDAAGVPATTTRAVAVITRTSGDDTFLAYGVLNDNVTSDGSYIKMIPAEDF